MIFHRVKSEGTAHNSYLVGSGNEAVVIDPRRDCRVYMDLAKQNGMKITMIFETHRNEDYVIGSVELQHLTGAEIFHGEGLDWRYGTIVKDGTPFSFGDYWITAISTPGHTDESMSYVLLDSPTTGAAMMVFTGDALFVNDTGRIDFYGPDEAQRLAGNLYDSIHKRILPLGDQVILCPGHGAGSVCGSNISDRDESTIGIEKIRNPWLQIQDRDEFTRLKVAEKPEYPPYFRIMEKYNLEGPPLLGDLPFPAPLSPEEFKEKMDAGAVVVDTGLPTVFGGAHVKGAYSVILESLSVYGGWVVPYDRPILLVPEKVDDVEEAVRYLVRSGYDRIEGYLHGGTEGWYNHGYPVEKLPLVSVHELKRKLDSGEDIFVLDVRDENEWRSGHIEGSENIYFGHLEAYLDAVPRNRPVALICSVGHRAGLAGSILLRAGFENATNVLGGYSAWVTAGFPIEITKG
jgi:hydroxyacylglutathione hydrolase